MENKVLDDTTLTTRTSDDVKTMVGEDGKTQTDSKREGGKCDTTLKTIAGGMGGMGGRVVRGGMELAQQDRMRQIDEILKNRKICYANSDELMKLVPDVADELNITTDVAFRSVMQYGKDQGWV